MRRGHILGDGSCNGCSETCIKKNSNVVVKAWKQQRVIAHQQKDTRWTFGKKGESSLWQALHKHKKRRARRILNSPNGWIIISMLLWPHKNYMALHGSGFLCAQLQRKSLLEGFFGHSQVRPRLLNSHPAVLSTQQTDNAHTPFGLTKHRQRFLSLLTQKPISL